MLIGVFAPNIRAGGGLRHLTELLRQWPTPGCDHDELIVWASPKLADSVGERPRMTIRCRRQSQTGVRSLFAQMGEWWLPHVDSCDVLFVPGGTFLGHHRALVYMSQNLLPFVSVERKRYRFRPNRLRLEALRFLQVRTIRRSIAAIFLTPTAKEIVTAAARLPSLPSTIIPHGIDKEFFLTPREQMDGQDPARPYRILYVSEVAPYKHQWNVVSAVASLRKQGWHLELTLVGGADHAAAKRLRASVARYDPGAEFVRITGPVRSDTICRLYHSADIFVFASTCENLPNILLEAMAAGLPIACSDRAPMPALLKGAGTFFDPERPDSLAFALLELLQDANKRQIVARLAFETAATYSWQRCAESTMTYLREIASSSADCPLG